MLIFWYLFLLLLKIDAATFETNVNHHFQDITKKLKLKNKINSFNLMIVLPHEQTSLHNTCNHVITNGQFVIDTFIKQPLTTIVFTDS